ncbi:MAG: hypothetical protein AB7F64_03715 [Gammaproteobacteria bacterium]
MHKLLSLNELRPYYIIPEVSLWQMSAFAVSRGWNRWQSAKQHGWEPYSHVTSKIVLGRIPDNTKELVLPPDVTLVVSLSTYEELSGRGVNWLGTSIVKPSQWQQENIEHVFVHMPDFTADVSAAAVLNAVMRIRYHVLRGGKVYLHCKAGRARSAMVLAVYFMIFGDEELQIAPNQPLAEILKLIREKREQITVGPDKQIKAVQILSEHYAAPEPVVLTKYTNVRDYLISLEGKNDICRLNTFKELAIYATYIQGYSKNQSANLIQAFFKEILDSTNGDWYERLIDGKGPLLMFNKPSEIEPETNRERSRLVAQFIEELEGWLLAKALIKVKESELNQLG